MSRTKRNIAYQNRKTKPYTLGAMLWKYKRGEHFNFNANQFMGNTNEKSKLEIKNANRSAKKTIRQNAKKESIEYLNTYSVVNVGKYDYSFKGKISDIPETLKENEDYLIKSYDSDGNFEGILLNEYAINEVIKQQILDCAIKSYGYKMIFQTI
jgi:hypothetical protein